MTTMPQKITLEDLARMVQAGFQETATNISTLEQRVAALEKKTAQLDYRMESGFAMVAEEFKKVYKMISMIDYGPEITDLRSRMLRVEKKLGLNK